MEVSGVGGGASSAYVCPQPRPVLTKAREEPPHCPEATANSQTLHMGGGGAGGLCWVEGMGVGELAGVVFHSAVVFCCD